MLIFQGVGYKLPDVNVSENVLHRHVSRPFFGGYSPLNLKDPLSCATKAKPLDLF